DEAALRPHRVSELLAIGNRLSADLAGGIHIVLRLNGVDDTHCGDPEFRKLIGIYPHAECVLPTEYLNARDARDSGQFVLELDDGVVCKEIDVVLSIRRRKPDHHKW